MPPLEPEARIVASQLKLFTFEKQPIVWAEHVRWRRLLRPVLRGAQGKVWTRVSRVRIPSWRYVIPCRGGTNRCSYIWSFVFSVPSRKVEIRQQLELQEWHHDQEGGNETCVETSAYACTPQWGCKPRVIGLSTLITAMDFSLLFGSVKAYLCLFDY